MSEHTHLWEYVEEDDDFLYFRCTVRGCHSIKRINKKTGKETIV